MADKFLLCAAPQGSREHRRTSRGDPHACDRNGVAQDSGRKCSHNRAKILLGRARGATAPAYARGCGQEKRGRKISPTVTVILASEVRPASLTYSLSAPSLSARRSPPSFAQGPLCA